MFNKQINCLDERRDMIMSALKFVGKHMKRHKGKIIIIDGIRFDKIINLDKENKNEKTNDTDI